MRKKNFLLVLGAVISVLLMISSATALNVHQANNSEIPDENPDLMNKKSKEKTENKCPLCSLSYNNPLKELACAILAALAGVLMVTIVGIPAALDIVERMEEMDC